MRRSSSPSPTSPAGRKFPAWADAGRLNGGSHPASLPDRNTLALWLVVLSAAPDFSLLDAQGTRVKLGALRGEVVLVNFWATHCAPCVLEMPWLDEFHARFRKRKFRVLGISLDESWADVRAFLAKKPVRYPVVPGTEALVDQYKVEAMPASFLVNRRGEVVWSHTGLIGRNTLEAVIRKHLP